MENNTNTDKVFSEIQKPSDFEFNGTVAGVFDDMVSRSVPYYEEMQRMTAEIAGRHAQLGTKIYDLGCSTGTTMLLMDKFVEEGIGFVGIDDSPEMIEKCREKLKNYKLSRNVELAVADLTEDVPVENASVVSLVLVLQFIRPLHRKKILKKIFDGMQPGGVIILIEKILTENTSFNREFIDFYYEYKRRNQYSELEISQKREALENVLIPYKSSENIKMLKKAGFGEVEVFFRWYNFTGIMAKKL